METNASASEHQNPDNERLCIKGTIKLISIDFFTLLYSFQTVDRGFLYQANRT